MSMTDTGHSQPIHAPVAPDDAKNYQAAFIWGTIVNALKSGWNHVAFFRKSLRVGSGAATLAALDGNDGLVASDGTVAGYYFRDRADTTKYAALYKNGTVRLFTSETAADLWLIDATTGLLTQKTAWTDASSLLVNSWVAGGAPYFNPAYAMDFATGRVWLRGAVKNGTATAGTIVFTLPAGFRPTASMLFAVDSNLAYGSVRVDSDGSVRIMAGVNALLSLNNIGFDTR